MLTVDQFNAALENGAYAWPGGYPMFFVMSDGEALSFDAAKENADLIREAIANNSNDGWRAVAFEINYEDEALYCAHTNKLIECAYPSDDSDARTFEYFINADERGEFRADVRNSDGETIWETEGAVFEDGFMSDKEDLAGLRAYLVSLDLMKDSDKLIKGQ